MEARTSGDDARYKTIGSDVVELSRYADISLENGEVVIYDVDNEDAWIQSDSSTTQDAMD